MNNLQKIAEKYFVNDKTEQLRFSSILEYQNLIQFLNKFIQKQSQQSCQNISMREYGFILTSNICLT